MRGRIVLFVVLALVTALVGAYVGRSTNTPTAIGEPSTATSADPSAGSVQRRPSGSGSLRPPAASSQQMGHKAGGPTAAGNPGSNATQPGHQPAAKPAPQPPPSTGPVRFGKVTTTPSDASVVTSIALDDHRALTTTFDNIQVGNEEPPKPNATRSFAMTLPLTGGAKGEMLRFYVQGAAFAAEGAYARLTLKLNGQATHRYYRNGFRDTFDEVLEVPATPATTYRLEGVVEVHQDPSNGKTDARRRTGWSSSLRTGVLAGHRNSGVQGAETPHRRRGHAGRRPATASRCAGTRGTAPRR
jgi:hypothetical protein